MPKPKARSDSAWKQLLDECFDEFLDFFFPQVRADLDTNRGYRPLDKELERLVTKSESGTRVADKVVEATLVEGKPVALVIHIEIQGQVDPSFERRMFVYNYRLFDRFQRDVVSLAVLTDPSSNFRPRCFSVERWGFRLLFEFPTAKLLDWDSRRDELDRSKNPFAWVVLAHLEALAAKTPAQRLESKKRLFSRFVARRPKPDAIITVFRFIDWIITLPKELEQQFEDHVVRVTRANKMPYYISNYERNAGKRWHAAGLKEGLQKGLLQAIEVSLSGHTQTERESLLTALESVSDAELLLEIQRAIIAGESIEQLRNRCP